MPINKQQMLDIIQFSSKLAQTYSNDEVYRMCDALCIQKSFRTKIFTENKDKFHKNNNENVTFLSHK